MMVGTTGGVDSQHALWTAVGLDSFGSPTFGSLLLISLLCAVTFGGFCYLLARNSGHGKRYAVHCAVIPTLWCALPYVGFLTGPVAMIYALVLAIKAPVYEHAELGSTTPREGNRTK